MSTRPKKRARRVRLRQAEKQLNNQNLIASAVCCNYWAMIAQRLSERLLSSFNCSACGILACDPLGWNGPGLPLCADCADGQEGCKHD
jgi:hypothetical protein